ncbi:CAP domain-containing protein [Actinomadura macrotermitis]|uniref:SCP domain-containing protein n=1 Tax=Actinomadura macrotermitis TaxID=2585200 RepID=A0A7K0BQ92_9ACTN|nr:CAP domain-containing protein [Actinomadura macrotermitis]MQY03345.1 hypothetical protein [Actinomadura macrotermitis]
MTNRDPFWETRRPRRMSGRAAAWTAAGVAGLVVTGAAAGLAGGAFQNSDGALTASGAAPSPVAAAARPAGDAPAATPTAKASRTPAGKAKPTRKRAPARKPVRKAKPAPVKKKPVVAAPVGGKAGRYASQVVTLVNAQRAKNGCRPLTVNAKLGRAAQAHSADMAARHYFDHTSKDGRSPGDRITAAGYRWITYGENIAMGQQTPASVMNAWMNSSGHRANILNCAFKEIGVGVALSGGPYWTQDFGATR